MPTMRSKASAKYGGSFAPIAFLLSMMTTLALSVSATSKLQIHIPQSLVQPGGYDHRDALFGIPPYGGSIQQQLYYAPTKLCEPTIDLAGSLPLSNKKESPAPPFILMVDRGDCTFVMKVRHAQRAGASAVLIADNMCQCNAVNCTNDDEFGECESTEPLMADDGSGADISIPAFLMFKQDADPIKAAMQKNQQVRAEMTFSIPAPDARVEYDLWTTPMNDLSADYVSTWRSAAVALDKDAYFTPHMYIYDGRRAGCVDMFDGDNLCYTLCTNNGRYCASDPDGDMERGVSGQDIVTESLRRLCIWQNYGLDGVGAPWWDYLEAFDQSCNDAKQFTDTACIAKAMAAAKIDSDAIGRCMTASGGLEGNATNTILEEELSHREISGVVVIPTLFVNQAPIRGTLSYSTVLKAVCAGFAPGYEPKVCSCAVCGDEERCVELGHCPAGEGGAAGVSLSTFASALFALTILFMVVGFVVYQRQQTRMREQVRGILAEYMPLGEQKRNADNSVGLPNDEDENNSNGDLQFTIS